MPRGGARPGAGRKPKDPAKAAAKKVAREPHGYTQASGAKTEDAPAGWPFGLDRAVQDQPPVEAAAVEKKSFKTPLEYWQHVLEDPQASPAAKHAAAYSMAPYVHPKIAPGAKKEEKASRAKQAGAGRFAPPQGPRLVVKNA